MEYRTTDRKRLTAVFMDTSKKYKYKQNPVKLPRHLRSIRSLYIEQYDSDSGSGETLGSSCESDEYDDDEESEYEESEYSEESEYDEDSEDLTDESLVLRRTRTYKYKENGVRLPHWCNSDKRY